MSPGKMTQVQKTGDRNSQQLTEKKKKHFEDEEIESESDEEDVRQPGKPTKEATSDEEEEDEETAQEKKLRLTKEYLAQLAEEERKDKEGKGIDHDAISHRLKEDVLEQSGRLLKNVACEYAQPAGDDLCILRGHKLAVTCLVISPDSKYIFSGSKDCSVIKWNIATRRKEHVIHGGRKGTEDKHKGHTDHVLCMAISSNNKYLATGGKDKIIHIWNPSTCELLHTFKGHKDFISGLAFRQGTSLLFSGSHDRSVKLWNVDDFAYMETLFGHQEAITSVDSLIRERAITSGGGDKSIRIWKVVEESQLVFTGHKGSIDCVKYLNEEFFFSGADDGSLALWTLSKKRPLVVIPNAHNESGSLANENWISSLATLQSTDLLASEEGCKGLRPLFDIPLMGFINCLQFSADGASLVAGVGQEHKLGRWWRIKEAKNSVVIIPLKKKPSTGEDGPINEEKDK
ncbi:putative U3 small nucleolar RNA-interacting protein 2-like [Apostichopus japonicus]|uniref:U3 small nucleolar RNA-interacting protein 2 n=1 Tax=Stichopus japonicus TaxID=307972 RepID=A0A2G8KZS8_STIJA|nr:putative U3 small nucleolar RNA-interacting protein 2-like [Apostichopus japonicus]